MIKYGFKNTLKSFEKVYRVCNYENFTFNNYWNILFIS